MDLPKEENIESTPKKPKTEHVVENAEESTIQLSKRQIKKLKKLEKWTVKKKAMRIKEREKYKQKRLQPDYSRNGQPSRKELKRNKIDPSKCKVTVAIDLSFDELMTDRDISKCVKQLLRVYTINRRSKSPINLYFTGVTENNRTYDILEKNDGYKNWDVNIENKSFMDLFDKDNIVYLTSESDNVLDNLDPNSVYIIGGLVDHNHQKGHCFNNAVKLGIKHARLPLIENIVIKNRTVLTIFHVFEILLKVSEGVSWQEALLQVLPSRKGAQPIVDSSNINNVDKSLDTEKIIIGN